MHLFPPRARPPLLRQAVAAVDAMLGRCGEMLEAAAATLLDNEPLEVDLVALDRDVNALEQEVRRLVLEHLAAEPERERVLALILVAVVPEVERIGDLAKALADTAGLAERPRIGPHVRPLRDLRDRIVPLSGLARRAFVEGDAEAAQRVADRHEGVLDDVRAFLERLARAQGVTPNEAVVLALAARMLGRVSSHLANVVSPVLVPFDQIRRPAV